MLKVDRRCSFCQLLCSQYSRPQLSGCQAAAAIIALFRVIDCACLADNIDFDLARVLQLGLDLLGNVAGQQCDGIVTHFVRLRDDSDFTSRLNRVGILNALGCICNFLKVQQTLDVGLECLTSCARSCCGKSVRCSDQNGLY